jgi:phosphopantothenoylcysteine decarboxylase/phosphopantothenate--cysteine ligase
MTQPQDLAGKHIVLGLSGGIACYKAAELTRALVKAGATVQVVMTAGAEAFITAVTLQALSGRPVYTSQWDARPDNNMAHINLSREADAILVAPASAEFMAKLVHGRADDLLSLMCLARPIDRCPLLVAPAMNREMWAHPATQRNVTQLRDDGTTLLGPDVGEQACLEFGEGRMLEAVDLRDELIAFFQPKILRGKRVLVTAGPTFEAIDPVRGITNHSSGKMGFAIARAAQEAGADVTLVAGPVHLPTPHRHRECAPDARGRDAARARQRRVRGHRGRRRLASRADERAQDQEGRQEDRTDFRADRERGHPRRRCPPVAASLLRRLRRREREPAQARARQARAQERAADRGQPRSGHVRP